MEPITTFSGRMVALPARDIDTDQIIPARFLKTINKEGLGKDLFHDWRYDSQGNPKSDFVLNRPSAEGAAILLAGDNFGCGSSREHAPWALLAFGFRAIVSTSFGDIFRNNSLKNGLLPIIVDQATHAEMFALVEKDRSTEAEVDLPKQVLRILGRPEASFSIDEFSKKCLTAGLDQLGYIQRQEAAIAAYEQALPGNIHTL